MTPFQRHLQAAVGFYELGLPLEACDELDELGPESAGLPEVLAVWVAVLQSLGKWERMESSARELCEKCPDEAQGFISLAYATRRARSLQHALLVLTEALERFPGEPIIHYNLACYYAQLGNLHRARDRLAHAISLEPACRQMALDDPDLTALRDELK